MPPECIRIAITLEDDSVMVMSFVIREYGHEGLRWSREATPEAIEKEIARARQAGLASGWTAPVRSWRIIKEDDIPLDRTYRNAWEDTGKKIVHNMTKVRGLVLRQLRWDRAPLLDALDKEWMKAMGQGNTARVQEVEKQRQALRDAPQKADKLLAKAKTIEAVKKISIESLA